MVASEALPYSKTGGLADVSMALSLSLGRLGHRVVLVTPRYRAVKVRTEPSEHATIVIGGEALDVGFIVEQVAPDVRVVFVECARLFDRDGLYGVGGHDHGDNPLRFALLAKAALVFAELDGLRPDVFHAHDWQAGLVPAYLRTHYAHHPALAAVPVVFTIHNLAYQGVFAKEWMPRLDLDWRLFQVDGLELWDQVSFLKAGINFSERITTVSRRYAQEILTPAYGFGFEGILARRRADLVGILNGIDVEEWNPAADPRIPRPYDAHHLEGKAVSKQVLLETYGFPAGPAELDVPVIGMIARMVPQKGLDLIAAIAEALPTLGARFVVLGTGDAPYEEMWRQLAERFPDRIAVRVGFDESLAHLIEAGADLFLMPSRFEPCGLNQMYSLRYGTLPIVRATGGLDDTVENYDPQARAGTGFKFWDYTPGALLGTVKWAIDVYRRDRAAWRRMQVAAMQADFSWNASAEQYLGVYWEARVASGAVDRTARRASPRAPRA
ncbi:MAG: glycogen synthase GlgA [Vicinamibacterales bacterium]